MSKPNPDQFKPEVRRKFLETFDADNPHLVGKRCHASRGDGECMWKDCPQLRDKEPEKTGRHCPLDRSRDEDEEG
jgi:hypothetical protein